MTVAVSLTVVMYDVNLSHEREPHDAQRVIRRCVDLRKKDRSTKKEILPVKMSKSNKCIMQIRCTYRVGFFIT